MTQSKPGPSITPSPEVQVVSRSSLSPLVKVYQSPQFQSAWDNDVKFQVARNLLRLRRFRNMSQAKVAKEMGTSQSALARIEAAEENITLGTLQRLIAALRGRLQISIAPEEMPVQSRRPWWEVYQSGTFSTTGWDLVWGAYRQVGTTEQIAFGLERDNGKTLMLTEATTNSI